MALNTEISEKVVEFRSAAPHAGNRLLASKDGSHRRSEVAPRKPSVAHVLAGGGYSLIHLLVVKNFPRALELLLAKSIVRPKGGKGTEAKEDLGGGGPGEVVNQVDPDVASCNNETALTMARAADLVECALVLEASTAEQGPGPPITWLDVWRAIADLPDTQAVEVLRRFRRHQGAVDPDGFGLDYQRMSRPEKRGYVGLRGHEWWGYAQETLGWTLAHMAARKNKPRCLAELEAAGATMDIKAVKAAHTMDEVTPLMLARMHDHPRCVSVLLDPKASRMVVTATSVAVTARQKNVEATSLPAHGHGHARQTGQHTSRNVMVAPPMPPDPAQRQRRRLEEEGAGRSHVHRHQDHELSARQRSGRDLSSQVQTLYSSAASQQSSWASMACPSGSKDQGQGAECAITYSQLWSSIEKEPEPQALRILETFVHAVPAHVVALTFDKQRLSSYDSRTGYTLAHLAAEMGFFECLCLLLDHMSPGARGTHDLSGRSPIEIARVWLSMQPKPVAGFATASEMARAAERLKRMGIIVEEWMAGTEAGYDVGPGETPVSWREVYAALRDRSDEEALPLVKKFVDDQDGVDQCGFTLAKTAGGLDGGRTLLSLAAEMKKYASLDILAGAAEAKGMGGRSALTGGTRYKTDGT
mmetsp:Transcript_47741/g.132519  ORF Transcript_47741/g.132519 Transcript_47741/m.132519 type:complete len:643 (-) Transcript_47741:513-2441(-)